jgi:hypothetical protein
MFGRKSFSSRTLAVAVTQPSRPASRAGFTILEVVLAMFILLIGMSVLLGLFSFGAALARTAALRTGASNAIEAVVADLEDSLFPLVVLDEREVAGPPERIVDRPVKGYPGLTYSAEAVPVSEAAPGPAVASEPREYAVSVEIRWSEQGSKRSRRFSTILLREVPFGERLRQRVVEGRTPPPAPAAAPAASHTP